MPSRDNSTEVVDLYEKRKHVFKYALIGLMQVRGVGVRELARRVDPQNPERGKRNIARYRAGDAFPNPAMQYALEDALGLEHGEIAAMVGSRQPAEPQPDTALLEDLYATLSVALGKRGRVTA